MRKKARKVLILTGVLCLIGVAACACQNTRKVPDEKQEQKDAEDEGLGEDSTDAGINMQAKENDVNEKNGSALSSETEEPKESEEKPIATKKAKDGDIMEDSPNLEGSIKNIKGTRITVVEAITGQSDNGGDIMIGPGSGDDSKFNKIKVTYNDDTVFVIKTIYDGGARYETEKGLASALAVGQMVQIWGTSAGDGIKATQISIVKVK